MSSSPTESVRDILARLGPPPPDIADIWCEQARAIADDIASRTGQSLPPIDLADWLVDSHGTVGVRWRPSAPDMSPPDHPIASVSTTADNVDSINERRLADFRNQVCGEWSPQQPTRDPSTTSGLTVHVSEVADDTTLGDPTVGDDAASAGTESKKRGRRSSVPTRNIAIAVVAGCLVLLAAWWLAGRSSITPDPADTQMTAAPDAAGLTPRVHQPDAVSVGDGAKFATKTDVGRAGDPLPPQTLESFAMTDPAVDLDHSLAESTSLLPFDSLVPAMNSSPFETAPQPRPVDASSARSSKPDSVADRDFSAAASLDESSLSIRVGDADVPQADALATHPETEAPESPQSVRTVKVQSFQLPAINDTAVSQPIGDGAVPDAVLDRLTLEFPLPISIAMKRRPAATADSAAVFDLLDTRNQTSLALLSRQSDGLVFQWKDTAKSSSQSSLLLHGRLRDTTGNVIYFRPRIEADAWALAFDKSDFHPSWDLDGLLPPKVARLKIGFDLPDEVEEAWIEPIDPASPRRTSGIAVLALKDNENVRVGLRFDIKCTTKLACQIRVAGRLDPAFAWQTFTEAGLADFANVLLSQADLVQQQIAKVEAIYDRADTDGRRILRPRRTAIKSYAEQLTELSRRVAELQSLVALLQTSAKLRFQVSVQWSDSEQVILTQQE
ncbi:hypothetical protein [Novipirellula sp.]|uniref:hypothetical protein n=1 Tax=Novipirellula sp. TaxID=2795430 RepID=UPI0035678D4C